MQTKNAIGNLVNRYRAILKKCNLLNTFGSLTIASAMVLGGAVIAQAKPITQENLKLNGNSVTAQYDNKDKPEVDKDGYIQIGTLTGSGTLTADNYVQFTKEQNWTGNITINAGLGEKIGNDQIAIDFQDKLTVKNGSVNLNAGKYYAEFIKDVTVDKANMNVTADKFIYFDENFTAQNNANINLTAKDDISFYNNFTVKNNSNININSSAVVNFTEKFTAENKSNVNITSKDNVQFFNDATVTNSNLNINAKNNITFEGKLDASNATNINLKSENGNIDFQKTVNVSNSTLTAKAHSIHFVDDLMADKGAKVTLTGKTTFDKNIIIKNDVTKPVSGAFTEVTIDEITDKVVASVEGYQDTMQGNGSALHIKKGLEHGGEFTTKTNGFISLGDHGIYTPNSPEADIHTLFNDASKNLAENVEGMDKLPYEKVENYYQSGAVIATPLSLKNTTINLIANGTADFKSGTTPTAQTNGLYVAKQNLLITDLANVAKNNATEKNNTLIDNTANKTVKFDNGSGLHVIGVTATGKDEYYTIIKGGVKDFTQATDKDKNGKIDKDSGVYVSGNALFDIKAEAKDDNLIANVTYIEDNGITTALDPSLGNLIGNHYKNGGGETNALVTGALNNAAMTNAQRVETIESAARSVIISGVPQQAINIATGTADYANARTSFTPHVAGAAAIADNGQYTNISAGDNMANGANLWIMPMYQHQKADGFQSGIYTTGYDSNFGGVVLGADYTWANSLRLGAMINMGTGSSESNGNLAKTENDFDSLGGGLYAGYMIGNIGLSADVNYTNVSNDVKQTNSLGLLAGEFDTNVISTGLKAEYNYQINDVNIIPHLGVRFSHINIDQANMVMAGQNVISTKDADANIWQFPVGVTVSKDIKTASGWNVKPMVDLSIIPVAGDKNMAQDISFTGINGVATMESEIMDSVSGRAQVGVEVSKNNYYMGLDYAYQGSSNMDSHNVQATFGIKF